MSAFRFPPSILSSHVAILGKTGSGKTSTGKLLIEQVVDENDARVCILDTVKSDWWGLTSSADGKRPGLPFHILGGPRGHVALHSGAGRAIAELVASGALPLSIVDMADFEPGGIQRFFIDFAPALIRHMRGVLYLVIEEAHELAPKERAGITGENMAVHYAKKLATAGRSKGVRLIVLSQRTQALHNAVLGSCETLIAHRFTTPADQKPIVDWLRANTEKSIAENVSQQLSGLRTGSAWIVSGEAKLYQAVSFPRIQTFDNSATPKADDHEHHVTTAPVDAEKLRAIVGTAVKEAEENDPKRLRAEIARLRAAAGKTSGDAISADALSRELAGAEERGYARGKAEAARILRDIATEAKRQIHASLGELNIAAGHVDSLAELAERAPVSQTHPNRHTAQRPAAATASAPPRPAADLSAVGSAKQRILDALAWLEAVGIERADKVRLALLADQSPKSSGYTNNLGALRSTGLIDYPTPGQVALTPAGRGAANAPERPPTTEDLHRTLEIRLPAPQWRILKALIGYYPESVAKGALAAEAGQSATSSGYTNNLGALRSLGFIDYPRPGEVAAESVLFLK